MSKPNIHRVVLTFPYGKRMPLLTCLMMHLPPDKKALVVNKPILVECTRWFLDDMWRPSAHWKFHRRMVNPWLHGYLSQVPLVPLQIITCQMHNKTQMLPTCDLEKTSRVLAKL
eukprot:PhF_6_TR15965/c0_g1_i1/m.24923